MDNHFCMDLLIKISKKILKLCMFKIALTTRQVANGEFKLNLANQFLAKIVDSAFWGILMNHKVAINFGKLLTL